MGGGGVGLSFWAKAADPTMSKPSVIPLTRARNISSISYRKWVLALGSDIDSVVTYGIDSAKHFNTIFARWGWIPPFRIGTIKMLHLARFDSQRETLTDAKHKEHCSVSPLYSQPAGADGSGLYTVLHRESLG